MNITAKKKPINITKSFVDRQIPSNKDLEYADENLKGFILRMSKSGAKSYLVRARIKGGKPVSYTIGKHGAPWNAMTARDEAERILALMKLGSDPRELAQEQKSKLHAKEIQKKIEQSRSGLTLSNAFSQWLKENRKTKESTKALYRQVMHKHLADWMEIPMADITPDMVDKRYNKIADETLASAGNTFRALRMLFNWVLARQEDLPPDQQIITKNPVTVLSRRDSWRAVEPRKDYIAAKDLPAWFKAVQSLENSIYRDYFQFVIVTGLRLTEASKLQWCDIDFENKVFTARNTKNGTDHTLPMTAFTEAIFRRRPTGQENEYVFPAKGGGYFRDVRHWINIVTERSGVEFTCHMLRKTLSNLSMDANISDRLRKMILNHRNKSDVTEEHYLKKDAELMREPLRIVERYILNLSKPQKKSGGSLKHIHHTSKHQTV